MILYRNSFFNCFDGNEENQQMQIRNAKIVPDLRVFQAQGVSKEFGRKVMKELAARGEIRPHTTQTGRSLLNFDDAERLAFNL